MNSSAGASFALIALMMCVVGMGIPVTAALNAGLGQHVGSPAASAILFEVGFLMTALVLAFTGLPARGAFANVSPWTYFAALGVVFYILAVTWSPPPRSIISLCSARRGPRSPSSARSAWL